MTMSKRKTAGLLAMGAGAAAGITFLAKKRQNGDSSSRMPWKRH